MKNVMITMVSLFVSLSSAQALDRTQRIEQVFNDLNKDTMYILDEFYHPEVEFSDPIGSHNGIQEVKDYYLNLYENVEEISFRFDRHTVQGDTHVGEWVMTLKTDGLNGGEAFDLIGNSVIVFDPQSNKVIYHRDYFDMGAFIYERVPVLSWIITKVKDRLKND